MTFAALFAAVLLLAANAFFVGAEFALLAPRRERLEQLAEGGGVRARAALASIRDLSFMLAGAQLGITMASLGLGYVAEPAVAHLLEAALGAVVELPEAVLHTIALVVALTIVVTLHMVLGEMVPKNIAISAPEASALWLALPMRAYTWAFRPFIRTLNELSNLGLRAMRIEPTDELVTAHTPDEMLLVLAQSRHEGLLDEHEHALLSATVSFAERDAGSAMVPRERVAAVPVTATVTEIEEVAAHHGHSRLLLYGEDLDDLRGYVHVKDLLEVPAAARHRPPAARRVRRMLVTPVTRPLPEVLLAMRRSRVHFAAVVDADGRTLGLVTLEDVLERLVGDIRDEHDRVGAARQP